MNYYDLSCELLEYGAIAYKFHVIGTGIRIFIYDVCVEFNIFFDRYVSDTSVILLLSVFIIYQCII